MASPIVLILVLGFFPAPLPPSAFLSSPDFRLSRTLPTAGTGTSPLRGPEPVPFPTVRPTQLHGIEINPYAAELAQVVIWIGYLQWMRDNGFNVPRDPILQPLQSIECRDAILDLSDPENPKPAQWPDADFIIGNPPFLGSKLFRKSGLADDYIQAMYKAYDLPNSSDLCCYWFERARQCIADSGTGIPRSTGILPVSSTGILPVQCPEGTTAGDTPAGSRARMALRLMGKMPMLRYAAN